jgi:hypothetical protein
MWCLYIEDARYVVFVYQAARVGFVLLSPRYVVFVYVLLS